MGLMKGLSSPRGRYFLVAGLLFWPFAPMMGIILGLLYIFYPSALVNAFIKYGGYITLPGFLNKAVQIDNVSMSYIERPATKDGEPTLVFIHGFTSQKLGWSPVFWYLPKSWRIIAVDLPGHGHSGFSDNFNYSINGIVSMLHKTFTSIGLEKFHIIGESLGSAIVGQYTSLHGDKIQSVTMLCPAITHRLEGGEYTPAMRLIEGQENTAERSPLLPTTADEFRKMLDLVLHDSSSSQKLPNKMFEAIISVHSKHYPHFEKIIQDVTEGCESKEVMKSRILHSRHIPSMVLWGQQDQICDVSGAKLLKRLSPTCKVVVIHKCGHCMTIERPKKCGQFIERFIKKLVN